MNTRTPFSIKAVQLSDVDLIVNEIAGKLRQDVEHNFKRFGAIIGISGGIDSSVCLALAVKAFGPHKVLGIMMPEKDSSPDSERLAHLLANKFGVEAIKEDLTQILMGFRCYERRDDAVRNVFPEYDSATHTMKISIKQGSQYNNLPPVFSLSIIDKEGSQKDQLLPVKEYLQIVAASNFKQRCRMSMLYYHAESRHYAVIGTPNKNEYEQGFFVKYGDGGADVMPIVNLYKTQVYQLARHLGIPDEIIHRTPTTDTYSAEQTQEEFFYQMPFEIMDLFWYGFENGYSPKEVAQVMNETEEHASAIYRNFGRKQKTTEYLRMAPMRDYYRINS